MNTYVEDKVNQLSYDHIFPHVNVVDSFNIARTAPVNNFRLKISVQPALPKKQ